MCLLRVRRAGRHAVARTCVPLRGRGLRRGAERHPAGARLPLVRFRVSRSRSGDAAARCRLRASRGADPEGDTRHSKDARHVARGVLQGDRTRGSDAEPLGERDPDSERGERPLSSPSGAA